MRHTPLFLLLLAAAVPLHAQTPRPAARATAKPVESSPTPRKSMVFPSTNARTPEMPVATPAPNTAAEANGATSVAAPKPVAKTGDDCLDLATNFFELLKREQIDEAYTSLTKGSKIGDRPEELRGLKTKTSEAISLFGAIRGFEVIESKSVGTTLRRYTIVSFGRDFPLRWRFYCYKADEQWRLVDLHVDDRLNGIFGEDSGPDGAEAKQ